MLSAVSKFPPPCRPENVRNVLAYTVTNCSSHSQRSSWMTACRLRRPALKSNVAENGVDQLGRYRSVAGLRGQRNTTNA